MIKLCSYVPRQWRSANPHPSLSGVSHPLPQTFLHHLIKDLFWREFNQTFKFKEYMFTCYQMIPTDGTLNRQHAIYTPWHRSHLAEKNILFSALTYH